MSNSPKSVFSDTARTVVRKPLPKQPSNVKTCLTKPGKILTLVLPLALPLALATLTALVLVVAMPYLLTLDLAGLIGVFLIALQSTTLATPFKYGRGLSVPLKSA